ncbi:spore protease YyaC [Paenibacillus woosongensis]|uniref:Spore protease YyaC n=1 Tax=Paenibacillus woosongensis TaxID=307580 RepID=A0A7X3CND1_9BACL|nr:spore protease YyaC [Paenibacillus woosongensis]MUG46603.1 spore protease YyaC [Paenibacillus woosongensis]
MRLEGRRLPYDSAFSQRKLTGKELPQFMRSIRQKHPQDLVTFLCIGTDRSTGDALGPLVGTQLEELGFSSVVGSLQHPCDADNLVHRMNAIPKEHVIIAIDACLGVPASVGSYIVSGKPLLPAQSVGGGLPEAGHYSIAAVVNVNGPKPYWTLGMTSLYKVMQMADEIVRAAAYGFGSGDE